MNIMARRWAPDFLSKIMYKYLLTLTLLTVNLLGNVAAYGDPLAEYAQKALLKNPEMQLRWHTLQAAIKEVDVARGAYFPRLDLSSASGRENSVTPGVAPLEFYRNSSSLTMTQTLYDGFATRDEVRRLNNAQLARYYEFLDASENTVLEAMRSYYDVLRNRKLYYLTEDNYVKHRTVFEQIQMKVKAGVGRRVDLEQAAGRLALSESNLVTDNANTHDVAARFQRIVGEVPAAELPESTPLGKQILRNTADAQVSVAVEFHPAILAAVENVRSAQHDLSERRSKYEPKIDFRTSRSISHNTNGLNGVYGDTVAEVVLNWSLFNGGSDVARTSQYAERLNTAKDQRDKVCRDIRQTLAIAYNDVWKLTDQLRYLEQHQLNIEKASVAYQKQFEVGQRTLLDLLDTENELYQAKRAYINAEYDLYAAQARTLAGLGKLVKTMGLTRLETADLPAMLGVDTEAPESCPPEAPVSISTRKDELDARAIEAVKAMAPAKSPETPAIPEQPVSEPSVPKPDGELLPGAETPGNADVNVLHAAPGSPEALVENWLKDWAGKKVDDYFAHYDVTFQPGKGATREKWEVERRKRIGEEKSPIRVQADNLKITYQGSNKATASFVEMLKVGAYKRISGKQLVLIRHEKEWKIQEEKVTRKYDAEIF